SKHFFLKNKYHRNKTQKYYINQGLKSIFIEKQLLYARMIVFTHQLQPHLRRIFHSFIPICFRPKGLPLIHHMLHSSILFMKMHQFTFQSTTSGFCNTKCIILDKRQLFSRSKWIPNTRWHAYQMVLLSQYMDMGPQTHVTAFKPRQSMFGHIRQICVEIVDDVVYA